MNGSSSGGVGWLLISYHKFNSIQFIHSVERERERERERAESREELILEAIHEVTRGHSDAVRHFTFLA